LLTFPFFHDRIQHAAYKLFVTGGHGGKWRGRERKEVWGEGGRREREGGLGRLGEENEEKEVR
jgi:hypothetical protein